MTEIDVVDVPSALPTHGDWAVAHDFAFANGGAEAVTRWLCHDALPGARLLYLAGDAKLAQTLTTGTAHQVLPATVNARTFRAMAPAVPLMLRQLPALQSNVLASSYAFASALRTDGHKVVYCHSPLRQAWSGAETYKAGGPLPERIGAQALGAYFRHYDKEAASSADTIIATSRAVRDRVVRYYGRDAEIIAPPVDDDTFRYLPQVDHEDYFIWAGRITEPYKRLGIVLDAFRDLPHLRLVVVGDGRDRERLELEAPANVRFLGWRSRADLAALYGRARAVVFPSEDDFGLVAAEAMACGTPVIAYGAGGALDTVRDGENGVLFASQTSRSIRMAIRRFDRLTWSSAGIAGDATARYGRRRFRDRMRVVLAEALR